MLNWLDLDILLFEWEMKSVNMIKRYEDKIIDYFNQQWWLISNEDNNPTTLLLHNIMQYLQFYWDALATEHLYCVCIECI